jgi:hypothetical protein
MYVGDANQPEPMTYPKDDIASYIVMGALLLFALIV